MNSPLAALVWELWQRHRLRLWGMLGTLLGFALFYPSFCAYMGLPLGHVDGLTELMTRFGPNGDALPTSAGAAARVVHALLLMLLLCGPFACLALSLFYTVWMFTITDANPRAPFAYPKRLFTLPISTPVLAIFPMIGGVVAVSLIYLGWSRLVPFPPVDVLNEYLNLLPWVTLLLMAQGIVWALNGFPFTRMLVLIAACWLVGYLSGPSVQDVSFLARNQTLILLALALGGAVLGLVGLHKIRHGAWQKWEWERRAASLLDALQLRGPAHFRSAAQAQFWLEWRLQGRPLFYMVVAFSGVPFLICALMVMITGPLDEGGPFRLGMFLATVPLFLHFCQGIGPGARRMLSFTGVRPVTNGELIVAELKSAAASSAASWLFTLVLLSLLPLLGEVDLADVPVLKENITVFWALTPVLFLGLMFLTWRMAVANQWCIVTPRSWMTGVPVANIYGPMVGIGLFLYLVRQPEYHDLMLQLLQVTLGLLGILKLVMAAWTLRRAVQRQLLAPTVVRNYLLIWLTLAALLLIPPWLLWRQAPWIVSLSLGLFLLVPLARIGLAPITLNRARHQ